MPRITVALPLALQLLGCVAPANAFILCVSSDGCVDVELARPGTRRCIETACDEGHGIDASHACRDIPILGDAVAPARGPVTGGGLAAVLPAPAPRRDRLAPLAGPSVARVAAPPGVPPRRTIVLQL